MKANAYRALAQNEDQGWFYEARRRAIARLFEQFVQSELPDRHQTLNLLDVGCGTGGTTEFLRNYGHVTGVEPSSVAIRWLQQRFHDLPVIQGTVEDLSKLLPAHEYDVASVLGVLSARGVKDPQGGLCALRRALKPGGWLIWSDATYPVLRRQHDAFVEVDRRFYPGEMKRMLTQAGFEIVHGAPMLAWGFPVALGLSLLCRARKALGLLRNLADEQDTSDDRPLPVWLNELLTRATYSEWQWSLSGIKAPVGVSYLLLARKPQLTAAEHAAEQRVEPTVQKRAA